MIHLKSKSTIFVFLVLIIGSVFSCSKQEEYELPEASYSILSFEPEAGLPGFHILIRGENFIPDLQSCCISKPQGISVFFGSLMADIRRLDLGDDGTQTLRVIVPDSAITSKISIRIGEEIVYSQNEFKILDQVLQPNVVPVIYSITPCGGIANQYVSIVGNHFVPTFPASRNPIPNMSTVKFDGVQAEVTDVYQNDVNEQSFSAIIPKGAVTGKISITSNNKTVLSEEDFVISEPQYIFNADVSNFAGSNAIGLIVDNEGNLITTSWSDPIIRKINLQGEIDVLLDLGHPAEHTINPGLAFDEIGNLFVTIDNSIKILTPDGDLVHFAGGVESGSVDGDRSTARFNWPSGLARDNEGNLFVADWFNDRIRKISKDGLVTTLAGSEKGFQDDYGSSAMFNGPFQLVLDNENNLIVSDPGNNRLRLITQEGEVSTIAGGKKGYRDGTVSEAYLNGPNGLSIDDKGGTFFTDSGNHAVRYLNSNGEILTVAGIGNYSDPLFGMVENGSANVASFGILYGITSNNDALYVAQVQPYSIRRIDLQN